MVFATTSTCNDAACTAHINATNKQVSGSCVYRIHVSVPIYTRFKVKLKCYKQVSSVLREASGCMILTPAHLLDHLKTLKCEPSGNLISLVSATLDA